MLLGGTRQPELVNLDDAGIIEIIGKELRRFLGLHAEPNILSITRWPQAVLQPDVDHLRHIETLRRQVASLPAARFSRSLF